MATYKLGFIGAGAMAEAIIKGAIHSGMYQGQEIVVSNRSQEKLVRLQQKLGIVAAQDNNAVIEQADIIFLAMKPQQMMDVAKEIKGKFRPDQLVVSILAGITIAKLAETFEIVRVVRTMPNTPMLVNAGMSAIAANDQVDSQQLAVIESIFNSMGKTIVIEEKLMDAVGAVSGSGPAYVYQFIEAMADGGVLVGLPRDMAYQLVVQTLIGAATMVMETGEHPGRLKDMVTSPGGTTIRACHALEKGAMRSSVIDAVEAAYLQSKQLASIK